MPARRARRAETPSADITIFAEISSPPARERMLASFSRLIFRTDEQRRRSAPSCKARRSIAWSKSLLSTTQALQALALKSRRWPPGEKTVAPNMPPRIKEPAGSSDSAIAAWPSSPAHCTGHPAPACSSSKIVLAPALAAYLAAIEPAGPAPMTATSKMSMIGKRDGRQ